MVKIEEAKLLNERENIVIKRAVEHMNEDNISYDDAFAIARNELGVDDMGSLHHTEKFGSTSFYYKAAVSAFGEKINGVPVKTIPPEKEEALVTAHNMGSELLYTKGMDIKKAAINDVVEKQKIKENQKVKKLEDQRKDIKPA